MGIDMQRVLKHFEGIDAKRNKAINEINYLTAKKDMYTHSYITNFKEEKRKELIEDRQERAVNARIEIANMKGELREKQFKDPYQVLYEDPNIPVINPEHKLLVEMQRDKQLRMLEKELGLADSMEDFEELIDRYGEDEYFYKLITLELKKRSLDSRNGSKYSSILSRLFADPQEIQELTRLSNSIKFFANLEQHPNGLDGATDLNNISYESLLP